MGRQKNRTPTLSFGELAVDSINKTLHLELDRGEVVMSGRAQSHAYRNHPNDYGRLQPHIARIISNPLYIGDDAKNVGKIELVGRIVSSGEYVLVAVQIEKDANGNYNIASFYPISDKKVQNRRGTGHLLNAK